MEGAHTKEIRKHQTLFEAVTPSAFSHLQQLLAACFTPAPIGFAIFDNKLRYQAINTFLVWMKLQGAFRQAGHDSARYAGAVRKKI